MDAAFSWIAVINKKAMQIYQIIFYLEKGTNGSRNVAGKLSFGNGVCLSGPIDNVHVGEMAYIKASSPPVFRSNVIQAVLPVLNGCLIAA